MIIRKVLLSIEIAIGLGYAVLFWGVISIFWIPAGPIFILMSGEWKPLVGALLYFPGLFFLFNLVALSLTNNEKWRIKNFLFMFSLFIFGNFCLISSFLDTLQKSPQQMLFVTYLPAAIIIHLLILVRHHFMDPFEG